MVPLGLGDFRMGLFIWCNTLSNTLHTKLSSTHLLLWAVLVCVMCNYFGVRFSSSVFCKYDKGKKDHKGINAKLERECFKTNWEKKNKETWVVCSATNNNRRRKRKGLYGSHAGCMFASCPGDRFFFTTQSRSIFPFWGVFGMEKGPVKEPHQILSNTTTTTRTTQRFQSTYKCRTNSIRRRKILYAMIFLFHFYLFELLLNVSIASHAVSSNTKISDIEVVIIVI